MEKTLRMLKFVKLLGKHLYVLLSSNQGHSNPTFYSSPDLNSQVRFSDHFLSGVSLSV